MVILLNAPPNSGKDTIADELVRSLGFIKKEFKTSLYEAYFNYHHVPESMVNILMNYFTSRELKDTPTELFNNKTPRQALIDFSEKVYKPLHGKDVFAKAAIEGLDANKHYVFSDCGFTEEVDSLAKSDIPLLLIQLDREGCTFDNDSRKYINLPTGYKNSYIKRINVSDDLTTTMTQVLITIQDANDILN